MATPRSDLRDGVLIAAAERSVPSIKHGGFPSWQFNMSPRGSLQLSEVDHLAVTKTVEQISCEANVIARRRPDLDL